jgi:hypothetical protein
MSNARRLRRSTWAIGLPGRAPSREARSLAASSTATALPPGTWHTSADMVALLARTRPVVSEAVHVPTGARFRLASLPDGPILSISAEDDVARELVIAHWDDPSGWANGQRWQIEPAQASTFAASALSTNESTITHSIEVEDGR